MECRDSHKNEYLACAVLRLFSSFSTVAFQVEDGALVAFVRQFLIFSVADRRIKIQICLLNEMIFKNSNDSHH